MIGMQPESHRGKEPTAVSYDTKASVSDPGHQSSFPDVWSEAGNQALVRLLQARILQAKLTIGHPGDPDEEEADRAAEELVSSAAPQTVRPKCAACANGVNCPACEEDQETRIRPKRTTSSTTALGAVMESRVAALRGGGQPLAASIRTFFEQRVGHDFSEVHVHTDGMAAELAHAIGARAFTVGQDLVFGASEFAPATMSGKRLLAHELMHVVQQRRISRTAASSTSPSSDGVLQRSNGHQGPEPAPAVPSGEPAAPKLLKPPDPKGDLVVHTGSNVTFSENPEYVRYQLETFAADKGLARIGIFESRDELYKFGSGLGPFLDPPVPAATPERARYLARVIVLVRRELNSLRRQIEAFRDNFQRRAVETTLSVLAQSKAEIEKERDRYGIKSESKYVFWTRYSMAQNAETADLVSSASAMLTKHNVFHKALEHFSSYEPPREGPPPANRDPESAALLTLEREAAQKRLAQAEQDYNLVRDEQEGKHPILASYRLNAYSAGTPTILAKLASGTSESRAAELGSEITKKLENVEKVRGDVVADPALVWKLPFIVEGTRQRPDIQGSPLGAPLKSTIVSEKVGEVQANEDILNGALAAVGVGLALLAAVPTGGLSVAAATGVATAGVAEGALGVALSIKAYHKYQFESAAAGTSFEQAKSISQDEPSLFWLALDILGAAVSAKGALESFRRIAQLRRLAVAAKTANRLEEAAALLDRLEQEGKNAAKTGASAGTRLRAETEALASTVGKDVQEIEANLSKIRPSSVEGYADEIPLAGNQFWRRTSNGVWCRFASPPRCLIPPGVIPVGVPTPTGGAAAEIQRIVTAGYQKLPNGFKALDAISGGKMELITTEAGTIVTQYTGAKGISIKYTSVTDAAKLRAKVGVDLNDLFQFTDETLEGVRVKSLGSKHLELIFEEGLVNSIDKSTLAALGELMAKAKDTYKISFNWFVFSGGRKLPGPKFFADQAKMLKNL